MSLYTSASTASQAAPPEAPRSIRTTTPLVLTRVQACARSSEQTHPDDGFHALIPREWFDGDHLRMKFDTNHQQLMPNLIKTDEGTYRAKPVDYVAQPKTGQKRKVSDEKELETLQARRLKLLRNLEELDEKIAAKKEIVDAKNAAKLAQQSQASLASTTASSSMGAGGGYAALSAPPPQSKGGPVFRSLLAAPSYASCSAPAPPGPSDDGAAQKARAEDARRMVDKAGELMEQGELEAAEEQLDCAERVLAAVKISD